MLPGGVLLLSFAAALLDIDKQDIELPRILVSSSMECPILSISQIGFGSLELLLCGSHKLESDHTSLMQGIFSVYKQASFLSEIRLGFIRHPLTFPGK